MNNGDTMTQEEFKVGDLVIYPQLIVNKQNKSMLCLIIMITKKNENTTQYILQSTKTGERYVAVKRWITHATSETQ